MNELKIVNESEYTGEEASPAITFVNSEDGSRLVFAGNVAEYAKINNQEKSVEITEPGVTEITPDKGYTGLSKVSVDTSAISGGSGGGGADLEGEYFLAKPNGRYWKFTCADYHFQGGVNIPFIDVDEITDEEYEALTEAFSILPRFAYSAVCASSGIPLDGSDIKTVSFIDTVIRMGEDGIAIIHRDGDYGYAIGAFQECSGEIEGIKYNGITHLIQFIMSMTQGIDISEEEAILMISEMFMIEQITKEEYESWYNW